MTCPQCGTEIPDSANGCEACGWGAKAKLQLVGSAGTLSVAVDIDIGKTLGSKICGDDCRFMDDIQFRLRQVDEAWVIKPYPRVKNPVFVNGTELIEDTQLSDGDKISLKDKAAFIDVKLI